MDDVRPRVGIALSGGVAKVVAHVGILKAFEEAGIPIDAIAATSGGAVIGAFVAAGRAPDDMVELAQAISWKRLTRVTIPRMGLLSNEKLEKYIIDSLGDIQIEDLDLPLAVVAADLTNGRKAVFTSGRLGPAIRASCSIPQLFAPVSIDGHLLADGGLVEYLPVQTLDEFDCDIKIGVNLGGIRNWHMADPKNLLEIALRVIGFVSQRNARISERHADFVVRPDLSSFGPYDLDRADELIRVGYEAGRRAAPPIVEHLRQLKVQKKGGEWKRMVHWLRRRSPLQTSGKREV